jgi:hypothetical protein
MEINKMNETLKGLLVGAALYVGVMTTDSNKPFIEENNLKVDEKIDPVQSALGIMEMRNKSLSYEIEEEEAETIFDYENQVVVNRVGIDYKTNQPFYEVKTEKIPLENLYSFDRIMRSKDSPVEFKMINHGRGQIWDKINHGCKDKNYIILSEDANDMDITEITRKEVGKYLRG